jgi:hypothetical protein
MIAGLVLGMVAGGFITVIAMAMFSIAGDADDYNDDAGA